MSTNKEQYDLQLIQTQAIVIINIVATGKKFHATMNQHLIIEMEHST